MRIRIETPMHSPFEADTIDTDPDLDLDGEFEVLSEDGERLIVSGWNCDIEVISAAPYPAGWYQVEA